MPEIVLCCENHSRVGNLPQSCRHNTSLDPLSCSFVSLHSLFLTLSLEEIIFRYYKKHWIHCLALSSPFTLSFSHFHRNKSLSAILQMVLETLSCSCFPFALFLSHGHGDRIVTYVTICLEFNLSLHKGFSAQNICQQNCFRYYSLQLTIY